MYKNFGYLLLFFFALNFTYVDAQIPNWEKKEKCKEHFKKFYDDIGKIIEICKDSDKLKYPIFLNKQIIDCESENLSDTHSDECHTAKLLDSYSQSEYTSATDCNNKESLSQEQLVECDYNSITTGDGDWTKNLTTSDIHDITKSSSSGNEKKVKEPESEENVVEALLMFNKLISGNLDYPEIPVEKRSGLNMFDEESAELIMKCWDSHQGNWLTFEKVDATIWRRLNDGPRTLPAKILESDDNAKKYYAPIKTIIGEIDVVLDFKKKIFQQKNDITGVERISCR